MKNKAMMLAVAAALASSSAWAQETLRVQTHFSAESTPGELISQWAEDLEVMSNGRVNVQMHFSSELVSQQETFSATSQGILDCNMTGVASAVSEDAGFQFAGDIMGGYDTPYQYLGWFFHGGGREVVQRELFDPNGMVAVGYFLQGHESLSSTLPLAGFDDLKDWKFRSPPGLETEIFASFGAKPVVMDFGEVPNALRTGIVDGADASVLNTNESLGLFDTAKYATFPGFHSMPSELLTCNKKKWNSLTPDLQRIVEVSIKGIALDLAILTEVKDKEAARRLQAEGVTLHDWSTEDRKAFREFARGRWEEWGKKSKAAQATVDSHVSFMKKLGLVD